jgi:hypothetical protein
MSALPNPGSYWLLLPYGESVNAAYCLRVCLRSVSRYSPHPDGSLTEDDVVRVALEVQHGAETRYWMLTRPTSDTRWAHDLRRAVTREIALAHAVWGPVDLEAFVAAYTRDTPPADPRFEGVPARAGGEGGDQ